MELAKSLPERINPDPERQILNVLIYIWIPSYSINDNLQSVDSKRLGREEGTKGNI